MSPSRTASRPPDSLSRYSGRGRGEGSSTKPQDHPSRNIPAALLTALALLLPTLARADLSPDAVHAAKRGTALVELPGTAGRRGFGSAFCIDARGLFVTNAHVAGVARERVKLILNPAETDQAIVDAVVLRSDADMDLAILQVDTDANTAAKFIPALELGDAKTLVDTMPVTAFGYPFGDALATEKDQYPTVSVNTGRVTSLRKRKGELDVIQFDAAVNPGNSGGPVLDDKGRVVGIVQSGVPGAGVNFAIPIDRLRPLLAKPEITLVPAALPIAQRSLERAFSIRVVSLLTPAPTYDVTLTLTTGSAAPRTFPAAPSKNGLFVARAVPVPATKGPRRLQLTAAFPAGSIVCRAADRAIRVGDKAIQLADVRQINRDAAIARVTLADGSILTGPLAGGADQVSADLGQLPLTLDLTKAASLTIEPADADAPAVTYHVTVKQGPAVVGEASGKIELTGAAAAAAPPDDWKIDFDW